MLATGVWGEGEEWGKGHGDVGVGAEEARRCWYRNDCRRGREMGLFKGDGGIRDREI